MQEIIKNINRKAEEEIGKIEREKEAEILTLEREHALKVKEEKEAKMRKFKKDLSEEIEEVHRQKESESGFALQRRKNEILEEAYRKSVEKINSFSEKDLKKIISILLNSVPEGLEVKKISAGKKTLSLIRSVFKVKFEEEIKEEGFILKTEEADFDFRISKVLEYLREKNDPEVIKILFGN